MKTVLISGYYDTGKSTTCLLLKERLLSKGGRKEVDLTPKNETDETIMIISLEGKYYGISSMGDSDFHIEQGVNNLMEVAKEKNLTMDYLFFTSRSKGKPLKIAVNIALTRNNDYYQFFSNKIQPNNDSAFRSQKEKFLDYILDTANIII